LTATHSDAAVALPVGEIDPDPDQPRKHFDQAALEELAESLRTHGQIQPIVVRPVGDRYVLIAGERRWRAAKLANLPTLQANIRRVDAQKAFELAVAENVQRDSLLPTEEARAYARIMEQRALRQADLARVLGVDRRRVSEKLSLLRLPDEVLVLLSARADNFSEKHAQLLAAAPEGTNVVELARRCVDEGWSVARLRSALDRSKAPSRPPTLFRNVQLNVNKRGGFSLTVRARSREEVMRTLDELRNVIRELEGSFADLSARADKSEEVTTTNT
jgi:ParB family chromosome partitioning protein